jgi:hypothetical protein
MGLDPKYIQLLGDALSSSLLASVPHFLKASFANNLIAAGRAPLHALVHKNRFTEAISGRVQEIMDTYQGLQMIYPGFSYTLRQSPVSVFLRSLGPMLYVSHLFPFLRSRALYSTSVTCFRSCVLVPYTLRQSPVSVPAFSWPYTLRQSPVSVPAFSCPIFHSRLVCLFVACVRMLSVCQIAAVRYSKHEAVETVDCCLPCFFVTVFLY